AERRGGGAAHADVGILERRQHCVGGGGVVGRYRRQRRQRREADGGVCVPQRDERGTLGVGRRLLEVPQAIECHLPLRRVPGRREVDEGRSQRGVVAHADENARGRPAEVPVVLAERLEEYRQRLGRRGA